LNLIMEGTSDAQGDAVRTAGSWANQMRALKATISDTATEIGSALLPVFTPLLSKFRELAQKYAPIVANAVKSVITTVSELAGAFYDLFTTSDQRWSAAAATIERHLGGIGKAIVGVVEVVQEEGWLALGPFLAEQLGAAWTDSIQPALAQWTTDFWDWLTGEDGAFKQASDVLGQLTVAISGWTDNNSEVLQNLGRDIGQAIINGIGDIMGSDGTGQSVLLAFLKSLTNAILTLDIEIYKAGQEIAYGLANKIAENVQSGTFRNIIVGALNSFFAGLSPFTVFGPLISMARSIGIRIPGFADGGMVPGPIGRPQLAMVHGGEMVLNPQQQQAMGGGRYDIYFHGDVPGGVDQNTLLTAITNALLGGANEARNRIPR